jgi:hypothetical protein
MRQSSPVVVKKLTCIDLVQSLLIRQKLHDVSGNLFILYILPETRPSRNGSFRQKLDHSRFAGNMLIYLIKNKPPSVAQRINA